MKINPSTLAALLLGMAIVGTTSVRAALIPIEPPSPDAAAPEYTPHDQRIREGNAALQSGDFGAAQAAFDEALRLAPSSYQAMLGLAAAAHELGDATAAVDWLAKALVAAPDRVEVIAAHARLSAELDDLPGAAERLQAAVDAHPGVREVRLALAEWLAERLRRPADAIPHYRALLTQNPEDGAALSGLGMALLADNQAEESIEVLKHALELDANNDRARQALGYAYLRADRADEAQETFSGLIAAGRHDAATRMGRADALLALGRVDAALEDYAAAARQAPKVAQVHIRHAAALERAGRLDEAEAAYLATLAIEPRNLKALNNLAYLSAERKTRLDDALRWAQQALEIGGESPALLDTLGWVHAARGEIAAARSAFERALVLAPDHAAARQHLAALSAMVAPVAAAATPPADAPTTQPLSDAALAQVGQADAVENVAEKPKERLEESMKAPALPPEAAPAPVQATEVMETPVTAAVETPIVKAEEAETQVLAALEQWRRAWEDKDIETYLATYVTTNSPRANQSRSEWEADRRSKLDKQGAIRVTVEAPEVIIDGDIATVTFEQGYKSRNYRDRTRKTLTWRETDGQWRIAQEQSEPM